MKLVDCYTGTTLSDTSSSSGSPFTDAVLSSAMQFIASPTGAAQADSASGRHASGVWRQRWKKDNDTDKEIDEGQGHPAFGLPGVGVRSLPVALVPSGGQFSSGARQGWQESALSPSEQQRRLDTVMQATALRLTASRLSERRHIWQVSMQLAQRLAQEMLASIAWRVKPDTLLHEAREVNAVGELPVNTSAPYVPMLKMPSPDARKDPYRSREGLDHSIGQTASLTGRPRSACPHGRDTTRCPHAREAAANARAEATDTTGNTYDGDRSSAVCNHCSRLVLIGHTTLVVPVTTGPDTAGAGLARFADKPHYDAIHRPTIGEAATRHKEVTDTLPKLNQSAPARLAERLKSLAPASAGDSPSYALKEKSKKDSKPAENTASSASAAKITRPPARDHSGLKSALLRRASSLLPTSSSK